MAFEYRIESTYIDNYGDYLVFTVTVESKVNNNNKNITQHHIH